MRAALDGLALAFMLVMIVAVPSVTYKLFLISDDLHTVAQNQKAIAATAEQQHDDFNEMLEHLAGVEKRRK